MKNKYIKIGLVAICIINSCKGSVYEEYLVAVKNTEFKSLESRLEFRRKWVGIFSSALASEDFNNHPDRDTVMAESMAIYQSLGNYDIALKFNDMLLSKHTENDSFKAQLLMNAAITSPNLPV